MEFGSVNRLKKSIVAAFRLRNLSVRSDAVAALESQLKYEKNVQKVLNLVLDEVTNRLSSGSVAIKNNLLNINDEVKSKSPSPQSKLGISGAKIVTRELLESIIAELSKDDEDLKKECLHIIEPEDLPKIRYDNSSKTFYFDKAKLKSSNPQSGDEEISETEVAEKEVLSGSTWGWMEEEKVERLNVYGDRLDLLRQIAERFESKKNLNKIRFRDGLPMEIDHLDGVDFSADKQEQIAFPKLGSLILQSNVNVKILGIITRSDDGKVYVEDDTARVQLNLENAVYPFDSFLIPGCIVIVSGVLSGDREKQILSPTISMPPLETATETMEYHSYIDFMRDENQSAFASTNTGDLKIAEEAAADDYFVIISDFHLDKPKLLDKLVSLLESRVSLPPKLLVLMGSFASDEFLKNCKLKDYITLFTNLEEALSAPTLKPVLMNMHIALIPDAKDFTIRKDMLPCTPILDIIKRDFEISMKRVAPQCKITFASNPCRITHYTKQFVFFRRDLKQEFSLKCSYLGQYVPDDNKDNERVSNLLRSQAHLYPISNSFADSFTIATFDAAFRLYPFPEMVFVGDSAIQSSRNNQIAFISSFANEMQYATFKPSDMFFQIEKA